MLVVGLLLLGADIVSAATRDCVTFENRRGHRVQVMDQECARREERQEKREEGDGVYNGRRKVGIVVGALLGGGLAHALGGDPAAIVGGVLGGAQTGTYVGSTFDADAKVRDVVKYSRELCRSAGHGYNSAAGVCVADEQGDTQPEAQALAPETTQQQPMTVAEALQKCLNDGHSGYDPEQDQCYNETTEMSEVEDETAPSSMVAAKVEMSEPTPGTLAWCEVEAPKYGFDANERKDRCRKVGREWGPIPTPNGPGCGCQKNANV